MRYYKFKIGAQKMFILVCLKVTFTHEKLPVDFPANHSETWYITL